jgi:hypothetical protein
VSIRTRKIRLHAVRRTGGLLSERVIPLAGKCLTDVLHLSLIPLELPLSPIRVFAIGIERALDVSVQCPQHPYPSVHHHIRAEIERMRVQVQRQRKEILQLQRAGINSLPAEALLARMLGNIDNMCAERDRLKRDQPARNLGALGGRNWSAP